MSRKPAHSLRRALYAGIAALLGAGPVKAQEGAEAESLIAAARTQYSETLETTLSGYKNFLESDGVRIGLIDPDAFTALDAAGMDAIGVLSRRQGLTLNPLLALHYRQQMTALGVDFTGQSKKFHASFAAARADRGKDVRADNASTGCAVLAPSFAAEGHALQGLPPELKALFFFRHEIWHCADARYDAPEKGDRMERKAVFIKKEVFADLGAVSDLIVKDGADLGVIEAVARARYNGVSHFSPPALGILKHEIGKMGMEAFRKLDDRARREIFYDIVERAAPGARELDFFFDLKKGEVEKEDFEAALRDRPQDYPKLAAFYADYYSRLATFNPAPVRGGRSLNAREEAAVEKWDAASVLRAKAARLKAEGAPVAALAAARGGLLNDLRARMVREPENASLPAMATKLEAAFRQEAGLSAVKGP